MRPEIRLTEAHLAELDAHLLQNKDEYAAALVCGVVRAPNGVPVLVCREIVALGDADVVTAPHGMHLELSPISTARLAKRASAAGLTLVLCHSHPFPGPVRPSPIDMATELDLCGRVLANRLGLPVGALVRGPDAVSARVWEAGVASPADVRVVGATTRSMLDDPADEDLDLFDRQVRLWGPTGQARIARCRFVIVGLGGTGSHVAAQLAHLGAHDFMLVDPDVVEATNLSRIIGSTPADLGRLKVDVAADLIRGVRPVARVHAVPASILEIAPEVLVEADIVLCCTDGHGSRQLLTELAQQYIVPVVDMGIEVQPGAKVSRAGGGVRVLHPGGPCLLCMGVLDPGLVREEFLSDDERRIEADRGYLRSVDVAAPSVIALNGVVASLAVVEVCELLTGVFGSSPDRVVYASERRATAPVGVDRASSCFICGVDGLLGMGGARRLPRRQPRAG